MDSSSIGTAWLKVKLGGGGTLTLCEYGSDLMIEVQHGDGTTVAGYLEPAELEQVKRFFGRLDELRSGPDQPPLEAQLRRDTWNFIRESTRDKLRGGDPSRQGADHPSEG